MNKGKGKKKYDSGEPTKKDVIRRCRETEDIYEILELTKHEDNEIRLAAASQLCPCKVKGDIEEFWDRVFEMVEDPDAKIRARILHIICDGSP